MEDITKKKTILDRGHYTAWFNRFYGHWCSRSHLVREYSDGPENSFLLLLLFRLARSKTKTFSRKRQLRASTFYDD